MVHVATKPHCCRRHWASTASVPRWPTGHHLPGASSPDSLPPFPHCTYPPPPPPPYSSAAAWRLPPRPFSFWAFEWSPGAAPMSPSRGLAGARRQLCCRRHSCRCRCRRCPWGCRCPLSEEKLPICASAPVEAAHPRPVVFVGRPRVGRPAPRTPRHCACRRPHHRRHRRYRRLRPGRPRPGAAGKAVPAAEWCRPPPPQWRRLPAGTGRAANGALLVGAVTAATAAPAAAVAAAPPAVAAARPVAARGASAAVTARRGGQLPPPPEGRRWGPPRPPATVPPRSWP